MKGYILAQIDTTNNGMSTISASKSIEDDERKEIKSIFDSYSRCLPQLFEEMSTLGYNIESVDFKNYGIVLILSRAIDEILKYSLSIIYKISLKNFNENIDFFNPMTYICINF